MAKKIGTSTSGIETSKRYQRRRAAARRAEEEAWSKQNGPVLIRIGDHEIYAKSQARKDIEKARAMLLQAINAESVRPST